MVHDELLAQLSRLQTRHTAGELRNSTFKSASGSEPTHVSRLARGTGSKGTCPVMMFACKHYCSSPQATAAFPSFQAAAPQPVMHGRQPDVSVFPKYSLAGESPVDPRLVVELEVCSLDCHLPHQNARASGSDIVYYVLALIASQTLCRSCTDLQERCESSMPTTC